MIFVLIQMTISEGWMKWRKYLQIHEFEIFSSFVPSPSVNILEIGGGDGMKSMFFKELDYKVECVDIEPWEHQFYPVIKIQKNQLPFETKSFDVIFSSNVITDLNDKKLFFNEINRVLKDDGIIIHEVPSSWWSFFTNFWHYVLIPQFILKSIFKTNNSSQQSTEKNTSFSQTVSKNSKLKRLFTHSLGDNPSFIHEIFYYTKKSWKNFFKSYNYDVIESQNHTLFFTGYGIFKNHLISFRKLLSIGFPSAYYFVLKKK